MIDFSHDEALLFRVLTSFFGHDHVIPHMTVMAVCGGALPPMEPIREQVVNSTNGDDGFDMNAWARQSKCLFTIVNGGCEPCMVIEFFSGFKSSVSLRDVEHQQYLLPILQAAGIRYCTISEPEFHEILNPTGTLDFFSFLKEKCEALGVAEA